MFAVFYFKMARSLEVSTKMPCRTSLHETLGVKTFDLRLELKPTDKNSHYLLLAMAIFFAFHKLQSLCVRLATVLEDTGDDEGHSEAASCDQWRTEGGGRNPPPPEIPKALQNRAKLNTIVKNVKSC